MMRDYKNSRVTERRTFGAATIAAIIAIVALLGWMGERDREHMAEIEFQREVINGFVAICPVGFGQDGSKGSQGEYWDEKAAGMNHVGKKAAGRMLDGRSWDEYPIEVGAS